MNEMTLNEEYNQLMKKAKKAWYMQYLGLYIMIFGMISLVFNAFRFLSLGEASLKHSLQILGCLSIVVFGIAISAIGAAKSSAPLQRRETIVKQLLSTIVTDFKWRGESVYSKSDKEKYGNLFVKNLSVERVRFSGSFKDAPVYFTNVVIHKDVGKKAVSPKGNWGQYYEMISPYNIKIPIRILAIRGKNHPYFLTKKPNEKRVELENMLFNKEFEIYTKTEVNGFYVLNPLVMEKLLNLKQKYGDFVLYAHDNVIQCFVETNGVIIDIKHLKNFKYLDLDSLKEEINYIMELIYDTNESLSKSVIKK